VRIHNAQNKKQINMKNLERVNERVNQLVNRFGLKEAKEIVITMCQANFPFEERFFWSCVLKQLNEIKNK